MKKAIYKGIFALLLIMVGFFVNPLLGNASAVSHAFCSGEGCNGQNPSHMGCVSDEILRWYGDISYNGSNIGRVEQWYSPSCNALWTNVQTYYTYHGTTFLFAEIIRPNPYYRGYSTTTQNGQNAHTSMVGFLSNMCYYSQGVERYPPGQNNSFNDFTHCY